MTIFSPWMVGRQETRKSISDAAVLGQALLGDVQLGHDLDAGGERVLEFHGRSHDIVKHAVDPEPDPEVFFVWLDVDIGGRALDGVGDEQVHQLDDGRFLAGALKLVHIHLFLFFLDLEVEFVLLLLDGELVIHLLQLDGVRRAVVFLDRPGDGALRCDHRLDIEARHELDVIHGEHVGRVSGGNGQSGTDAAQRDDLVFLGGFQGDQLDHVGIDFEIIQVDRRDAVLVAEHVGDVVFRHEVQLHENGADPAAVFFLVLESLVQLFG